MTIRWGRSGLVPRHRLLPVVDALADDVRRGVACGVEVLVEVDRETAGPLQWRRATPIAIAGSDSSVIACMLSTW
ncbi:hypothetical protein GCM10022263_04070 [Nocardioides daeguensis]|uniref:Uncharacterized protein n=1 Tax=Nocardioides daeguensis TaxID=908359 RepID=A0ABP6US75_9ACTN